MFARVTSFAGRALVFRNDHDLETAQSSLVKILPKEVSVSRSSVPESVDITNSNVPRHYCLICYVLRGSYKEWTKPEDMKYHMKAK